MKQVTKQIAITANTFTHITALKKDNSPLTVRRNGKTQLWKTRPNDFKVPVKYGLYEYFYITQDNCNEWNVND